MSILMHNTSESGLGQGPELDGGNGLYLDGGIMLINGSPTSLCRRPVCWCLFAEGRFVDISLPKADLLASLW